MVFKTLIIEDELPARLRLQKLLSKHSDKIEIIGTAIDGNDGLNQIKKCNPDLIFLDIQMPGMTGFEIISKLEKVPLNIFCTAYDEYALHAFETNSIDYLLKPLKEERLGQSILKLERHHPGLNNKEILNFLRFYEQKETKKEVTSLTVKSGKKMFFLKLKEVVYFKAEDKYVKIYMRNGDEHLSEQSLQAFENLLPQDYKRIHRSLIINSNYIKEIHTYFNSRFSFILNDKNQTKLISSRSFLKEIKDWTKI
ncbi:LytTR family DNA-binding domain-containing protein [Antarcticibacterium sp. 1MA-6-2]|uniref:LytR/AlgR family response regulator transcription factor n=1 Tax=Antarcticibacterium sp. 1MA-6-2 TaxID=2908210 RepID=UPI001F2B3ECB|nr:LytTR family DNA-binding domain-containing protein [Antarcticibacterium sp. 1MA-6-2]UJH90543.1 LytTR family DNA-binding domain-containing protein [Antarcticibacterium sp. 1MA-6-2]